LCEKLKSGADFQQAADITFRIAGEEYGTGSKEQNTVKKGWAEVGIQTGPVSEKGH